MPDPVLLGESAHAQHLVGELQHQLGQPVAEAVKQREGRRHCPGCTLSITMVQISVVHVLRNIVGAYVSGTDLQLIFLSWIRIRTGNTETHPDTVAMKLPEAKKQTSHTF